MDIAAARTRVDEARAQAEQDPAALQDALTSLGNVFAAASQHSAAVAAYNEALQMAERQHGFESIHVLAPLSGVSTALNKSGHHQEAVPRLQRALALQRAHYGLFDLRQQTTLHELASSLTALNRESEAQDLMIYRARVAEKAYGEGDPRVIPALCELGDWFAETGKTPEARMTFKAALDNVALKLSPDHLEAVAPLRGLARAYMLRQSYPEQWLRPPSPPDCTIPSPECSMPLRIDAFGHPIVMPRKLYPEGEEALRRALQILEADPRSSQEVRAETLIQLGDWFQIKDSPREALAYYQQAWHLMESTATGAAATALSSPVRVYYPTPAIAAHIPSTPPGSTQLESVRVEFTVRGDGSVEHARIVSHDTREQYARDVLAAVRVSRFRPKFVNGTPVATPGIEFREILWRPRAEE